MPGSIGICPGPLVQGNSPALPCLLASSHPWKVNPLIPTELTDVGYVSHLPSQYSLRDFSLQLVHVIGSVGLDQGSQLDIIVPKLSWRMSLHLPPSNHCLDFMDLTLSGILPRAVGIYVVIWTVSLAGPLPKFPSSEGFGPI